MESKVVKSAHPIEAQDLDNFYRVGWDLITVVPHKDDFGRIIYYHYFRRQIKIMRK